MALINKQDAVNAINAVDNYDDGLAFEVLSHACRDVALLPEVDAETVIRCKDCKYLRFTGTIWRCQNRSVMMLCEPNDYCSRAERKEE